VIKALNIVKPRFDGPLGGSGMRAMDGDSIPETYTMTAQFSKQLYVPRFSTKDAGFDPLMDDFDEALTHSSFPQLLLYEGIAAFTTPPSAVVKPAATGDLQKEVEALRAQLATSRTIQIAFAGEASQLASELTRLQEEQKAKKRAKHIRRIRRAKADTIRRRKIMGEKVETDEEIQLEDDDEEQELSSSTDEMMGSD